MHQAAEAVDDPVTGEVHQFHRPLLARLEANTALTVLNRDVPELELVDDTPQWRDTFTARSLHRMPVRWAK